eukprot:3566398-Rhodomonas_salina.1
MGPLAAGCVRALQIERTPPDLRHQANMSQHVLELNCDLTPGIQGLVALETFQGSRTPITDPLARGALLGLSLRHTKGDSWRCAFDRDEAKSCATQTAACVSIRLKT